MEKKIEKIKNNYDKDGQEIIQKAFNFRDKNDEFARSLAMAKTLSQLNMDADAVVAALLYKNQGLNLKEIEKIFGKDIVFLVNSASNLKSLDFSGQKKELFENFRRMILATARDIRVVMIKLADILYEMKNINNSPLEEKKKISEEVLEIYSPLAARLGIGWLKGELEDLAFPHVHPKEYKELLCKAENLLRDNKVYIEKLKPKVRRLLKNEEIKPILVEARTKHLYSLWCKLKRYDNDITKIYDLVALRIITDNVSGCYTTLGILHNHWKPVPERVKDYIALPKPNGYQSLHTTVFGENGKITEFQIRTPKMHEEAELGIASHWAYKEKAKPFKKNLAWIQQLREWQKAASADELIESLKIDFFRDRIFVFTPKGDVIDLPEGATPIDFAYAIHSDLGDRLSLAKVNGKPIPVSSSLKNNDIVEILTIKNKKPSQDWLNFVKTSRARSKIRDTLRKS